jgi:1-acyl-sn-glycerol-3-phosphate acyltransferase
LQAAGEGTLTEAAHRFVALERSRISLPWIRPDVAGIFRAPMPGMVFRDRLLFRSLAALATRQIKSIRGVENIAPDRGPFIVAINHGTWREAVLVPSLMFVLRGGNRIHFLADWNFRIVPGIGMIFRRAEVVTVTRKDAKPKFLTVFRRFYENPVPPMERARAHLLAGRPIGIFPEGTVNRDPKKLLVGRVGMARLSLETGVPVVPVGIRFPYADRERPIPENSIMEIDIGPAMAPPPASESPTAGDVRRWHAAVMTEISRLSGKSWGR